MANSATAVGGVANRQDRTTHRPWIVEQVLVTRDTAADITVKTPGSGKRVALVGLTGVDGTAGNMTLKSGSTTIAGPFELTTNQGFFNGVGNVLAYTAINSALVVNFSANVDGMTFFVVECDSQIPSL